MRQRQQRSDDEHDAPIPLAEDVEDRGAARERAGHLADRQVAQLQADPEIDLDEEAGLDVEGLDDAVDAAARGPAPGGGGALGESAAVEAPAPQTAAAEKAEPEKGADRPGARPAGAPAPVPEEARAPVEAATGADFSGVRVHTDSPLADEMGAAALAMGDEIHVAPGAPRPDSADGRRLLHHELTHVVQQREGRVDGADGAVNDDADLEAEADAAAQAPAKPAPATAAAAPVQRRPKVKKVTAKYESAAALRGKKLGEFLAFVRGQLDWAVKLTAPEKAPLQELLTWTTRTPSLAGGCADISVDDLIKAANRPAVEAYARAVNIPDSAPTAKIDPVDNIVEATAIGVALLRLHTAIDGRCLYHISNPAWMSELIKGGFTEALVKYVTVCKPALHAPNGKELESFIAFTREAGDPTKYKGSLPKIRNYHRFEAAALNGLATNFGDRSRSRPLGLILHTALDWNGAFHRDPNITSLIQHPRNLMLMVEGYASLGDYQAEIAPLAKAYGRGGKIDQVMIAGHGSAQSMELAGEVAPGVEDGIPTMNQSKNDGLDVANKPKETQAFFDEIIANMEEKPVWPWDDDNARRVVFNACLTGANDIEITDTAKGGAPYDQQIQDSLKNHPSLSTSFGQRAASQGKDVESIGANGSFGAIELMHAMWRYPQVFMEPDENGVMQPVVKSMPVPNGVMELGSAVDPSLTAPKLEYLEKGDDPPGVMMALLEVWKDPSKGPAPWQAAADKHIKAAGAGWHDTQIKTLLDIVRKKYNADPPGIRSIVKIAEAMEYLDIEMPSRTWIAEAIAKHVDGADIIKGLDTSTGFSWPAKVIVGHARVMLGQGKAFIDELDTGWVATDLRELVDAKFLDGKGLLAGLLTPTKTPRQGQIILAAVDVFKGGGTLTSQTFLKNLLDGSRFPGALGIGKMLGNKTEDDLLEKLGVLHPATPSVEPEKANVNLDGDSKNETYLDPVNLPGTVTASALNVRSRPSRGATVLGTLASGDSVFVVGRTGDWLGIDYRHGAHHPRTAFVHKDHVTVA